MLKHGKTKNSKPFNDTELNTNNNKDDKKRQPTNKFSLLSVVESDDDEMIDQKKQFNHEPSTEQSNDVYVFNKFSVGNDEWAMIKKERQRKNNNNTQYKRNVNVSRIKIDEADEIENKPLYIEEHDDSTDLGNDLYFSTPWTVWVHKSDCNVWTEDSYTNIYVINNIGSFWRFFNNFHMLDKSRNQFFIMRNKIKPIWEDNENKKGGICSIKLDCTSKYGRSDIGVEAMVCISLLVMNETLVTPNSDEINGISYSIKNRSVLIKLWTKNYANKINEKLPIVLMNRLETLLKNNDKYSYKKTEGDNRSKINVKYSQIEPEYELENQ